MQLSNQSVVDASNRPSVSPVTRLESSIAPATVAPVWFITGCSSGFGLELARLAIAQGFRTVVTARKPGGLQGLETHGNVLVLRLDVTQPFCIAAAVAAAERRFGHIDVLVNNAGIGYFSSIEEGEAEAVHALFDVNVFGMCAMVQAVLPGMRRRRQGCIVNFSSLGGTRTLPALGYYNASKFAVEGLSEALLQEVEPLGLHVMVVEPSGLRTHWAGGSAPERTQQIDDYVATAGAVCLQLGAQTGQPPSDPVPAAQAILAAVQTGQPPHHLLLSVVEPVARSADCSIPEQTNESAQLPVSTPPTHHAMKPEVVLRSKFQRRLADELPLYAAPQTGGRPLA